MVKHERFSGFRSVLASAVRFWRWAVPVTVTALAVTIWLVETRPYDVYTDTLAGGYRPGWLTLSWVIGFLIASPTMLYYRALIWLGERLGEAASRMLVPTLVLIGSIVPPWLHDVIVDRQVPRREMRAPLRANVDTIALVGDDIGPDHGQLHCNDDCLRLLFGRVARRVMIVDATALGSMKHYGPAPRYPVLTLERRSRCPQVATKYHDYPDQSRIHELLIYPSPDQSAPENRALALVAAGLCPIVGEADLSSVDLLLGSAFLRGRFGPAITPNSFGLLGGQFAFAEIRHGRERERVAQHVVFAHYAKWRVPFAFLPYRWGWLSGRVDSNVGGPNEYQQKWQWAGLRLPDVERTEAAPPASATVAPRAAEGRPAAWPSGGPYVHRVGWGFFKWDILMLFAVMGAATWLALTIAARRSRGT